MARTQGIVIVQVFLSSGRTTEQKKAFYARAANLLAAEAMVRPEDVTVVLTENTREDWSFGQGVAQYHTTEGAVEMIALGRSLRH